MDALLPPEGWSAAAQLRFDSGDVPKRVGTFLTSLREGMERTMALTGCRSLDEIDRELVAWKR